MSTFTSKALNDYLCLSEPNVQLLIAKSFIQMDPDALTEENIATLFNKNPKLIGSVDEFVSWYYLDYCVDEAEATGKRYDLIQDRNWRRMAGYE
jgi:hypothetical protein